ncbi:hypothetical protein D3C80_1150030 [compost metagenome]
MVLPPPIPNFKTPPFLGVSAPCALASVMKPAESAARLAAPARKCRRSSEKEKGEDVMFGFPVFYRGRTRRGWQWRIVLDGSALDTDARRGV